MVYSVHEILATPSVVSPASNVDCQLRELVTNAADGSCYTLVLDGRLSVVVAFAFELCSRNSQQADR